MFDGEDDDEENESSEGGIVMQSSEIFFPLPALRAATHKSARSSRLMWVIGFPLLDEFLLFL